MELRNRRRRPKEDMPSLYSDIRRLLSPDPSNVKETVGRDAFWMRWVIRSFECASWKRVRRRWTMPYAPL